MHKMLSPSGYRLSAVWTDHSRAELNLWQWQTELAAPLAAPQPAAGWQGIPPGCQKLPDQTLMSVAAVFVEANADYQPKGCRCYSLLLLNNDVIIDYYLIKSFSPIT
ncbi:hypothetical protein AMECASPLE_036265 [Ameca splendens]|uniref:Uncharacterized protein n=1 Tax=Ameca splendens TaxID=208324 RepID=A0ABV0Y7F8_9TELE